MSAVELEGVTKTFGVTTVIPGMSLRIEKGEFVSLLGPSGCGKTTLLRIIAGLEQASSGRVVIGGVDCTALPPERRDIAMVFQSYALLPHLNVRDNVLFPLRMRRLGDARSQERRVDEVLKMVELAHLAHRKPRELSGGQQQRVAVARAVVSQPQVLLLDEPLSNLDARLRESMQEELSALHRQTGLTSVFVTHDQEEAFSLSDRVVLLNGGRIEQEGRPDELYEAPRTRFAATFLGASNVLEVELADAGAGAIASLGDGLGLRVGGRHPNGPAALMCRQEDVTLCAADVPGSLPARVKTRLFLGARVRYVLQVGAHELRCVANDGAPLAVGASVHVHIAPDRVRRLAD